MMKYDIKDIKLADKGKGRIEWAVKRMPVLKLIRERFRKEKPLRDIRIGACLHVTTETAVLVSTLKEGGASVSLCASNPLSTQDEVAASLIRDYAISVFAVGGEDNDTYYSHINDVLNANPSVTMDDGADLVSTIHKKRRELVDGILGGTEETTTGVIRLKSLEKKGGLLFPMVAVNDANTKHLFDNRYGTGQSTVDGIIRLTNILLAGATFVVCGYGWCGRGIALRARGMGANVIVSEVSPLRALEAVMDGFRVMPLVDAAGLGDVFVTATGDAKVIAGKHFEAMKDGAVVANSGHFNVEVEIEALEKVSTSKRRVKHLIDEYTMPDGRKINLLGEGRLVNLAGADGHPPAVMDMSFANQALCAEFIVKQGCGLEKRVYSVPEDIDAQIAKLKLSAMGVKIDRLTSEQEEYLTSWELGT
jgi:adenosylhomocysteinase